MSQYKLIIDDNIEENNHTCHCDWCFQTRRLGLEFDHFEAKTNLQRRMTEVIKKLESRYKTPHKCEDNYDNGICKICGFEF